MNKELYYLILIAIVHIDSTVSRLIYPPFFEEYDVGHLFSIGQHQRVKRNKEQSISNQPLGSLGSSKPHCSEDKLMTFLAEIQVINPESILKIAAIEELSRMCRQISENIEKTEKYLATCDPPNQPDLYLQLIKGVESLHEKLCTNVDFQKKFETYHHCLKEMNNEFESCNGPADWNEDSEPSKICTAYKQTVDCYYIKTAKVCGKDAASTMRELMEAIINSIITVKCDLGGAPSVPDAMPKTYIEKTENKKGRGSTSTRQMTSLNTIFILKLIIITIMI